MVILIYICKCFVAVNFWVAYAEFSPHDFHLLILKIWVFFLDVYKLICHNIWIYCAIKIDDFLFIHYILQFYTSH